MIFKSPVYSQASGSVAGLTYSRNQGGMYVRARAVPTNPNTEQQTAVRDAMRTAVNAWSNVLDDEQRTVWNTYAFNTPTLNKLGEPTTKTGQQMFIRGNVPRIQAALAIADDGPTSFDIGEFTPVIFTADGSADTFDVSFTNTDEWAGEVGSQMFIYQSRPQNPTRVFFKGPYQLASGIPGAVVPPTSPQTVTSLFPLTPGQRLFLKICVSRADGRWSSPQMLSAIVSA